jgi:sugar phosphate isomerase/epimerase
VFISLGIRSIGAIAMCSNLDARIAHADAPPAKPHSVIVGLQLHSLRERMAKDVPGSLDEVSRWGIVDVELGAMFGQTAEQYRKELDAHHLKASGIHFQWHDFLTNMDGVIRDAKTLGCEYVTLPWVPHKGDFTVDDARNAAGKFDEWGKKLSEAGLRFCYHPHGYEFRPYQDGTLFDLIATTTKPEFVNFELDVFWAYDGGADPVKLMQKYPTRFPLLHLKDMDKSVKTPEWKPTVHHDMDVILGAGQIDIAGILKEGQKIGVKHYYIEDESSRSEQQIPPSVQYIYAKTDAGKP